MNVVKFIPLPLPTEVTVPVVVLYPAPLVSWLVLVTLVAPTAMPSSLVLSASVIKPANAIVAAGIVALVPVLEFTVPVVAAVV